MILYIDTTEKDYLFLAIKNDNQILISKKEKVGRKQTEKFLIILENLLIKKKLKLKDIKKIEVKNGEGSFTSLRIGITIANALAYGLGIDVFDSFGKNIKNKDFSIVEPKYSFNVEYHVKKD